MNKKRKWPQFRKFIGASSKRSVLGVALFLPMFAGAASALALSPETTTLVTEISVEIPYSFSNEKNVVLIGASDCKKLIKDNSKVKVTYKTRLNTLSNAKLFDGVMSFKVARNSTARIDCTGTSSICSEIDPMYITQLADKVVVDIPFSTFSGISNEAACDTEDVELFMRAQFRALPTDTTLSLADVKFVVDAVGPKPPTLDSVSSTTSTMVVELTTSGNADIVKFGMVASQDPLTAGQTVDIAANKPLIFGTSKTTRATLSVQLEAEKKYYVGIVAQDETGNFSTLSNVVEVTPAVTKNFWEVYQEEGGTDPGGCSALSSTGGSRSIPVSLLILAALGFLFRRRKRQLDS